MLVYSWGDSSEFWSAEVFRDEVKLGETGTLKSVEATLRKALKLAEKPPKKSSP